MIKYERFWDLVVPYLCDGDAKTILENSPVYQIREMLTLEDLVSKYNNDNKSLFVLDGHLQMKH